MNDLCIIFIPCHIVLCYAINCHITYSANVSWHHEYEICKGKKLPLAIHLYSVYTHKDTTQYAQLRGSMTADGGMNCFLPAANIILQG